MLLRSSTSDNQLGGDAWKVDAYNNYAYALNNPIKYADPSGHGAGEDIAITATVAVVAGVEVVSAVLTGGGDIPELVAGDLALTATLESSEELTVESTLELTSDLEDVSSVDSFLDSDDEESDMEVDDPEDEDFVPNSKKQSNRSKYMGATPQKNSPVGREVIERMRGENKVRYYGKNTEFMGSDGIWRNIKDADMSHKHNKTAVIRWNEKYYVFGERSPQVRRFMNKSKHYYLEYKRINRREGGLLKARYRKPVKRGKARTILVRKLVE